MGLAILSAAEGCRTITCKATGDRRQDKGEPSMADEKTHQIVLFGKAGCDKCALLNKRVDKLLQKPEWKRFVKIYHDIMTEDGLIDFCNAECINPQRIPALAVRKLDADSGEYHYVANDKPGSRDAVCGSSKLYTYLGLQTDYSGNGTITPQMISHILEEAVRI
jgi:hypothetical protein